MFREIYHVTVQLIPYCTCPSSPSSLRELAQQTMAYQIRRTIITSALLTSNHSYGWL